MIAIIVSRTLTSISRHNLLGPNMSPRKTIPFGVCRTLFQRYRVELSRTAITSHHSLPLRIRRSFDPHDLNAVGVVNAESVVLVIGSLTLPGMISCIETLARNLRLRSTYHTSDQPCKRQRIVVTILALQQVSRLSPFPHPSS